VYEIAVIGATLSGNKGAASMLQSVLDNLPPLLGDVRFHVLSVYPAADREINRDPRVEIVPARPAALVLATPLAALWALLNRLGLGKRLLASSPILTALRRSQLLIDVSGISFSDGRVLELGYNVACLLPSLLMGQPVVKYSQAMGPFRTLLNRSLARSLLPRLALVIARGERTQEFLRELGLDGVPVCADAAFSMLEPETEESRQALAALDRFDGRRIVGISPSSVVENYARRHGIDYPQVMADLADRIIGAGYGVYLIAHAVRRSRRRGRTSDVETCQTIYGKVRARTYCHLVVEDYAPTTLRAVIGECDFFVASRFHAMVSSLARGVPTVVTGWSHKYVEVLDMFELGEWAVGYQQLDADALWDMFQRLVARETEVRAKIARHLPGVVASSKENAVHTAALLQR